MRVLVTGASGLVGAETFIQLAVDPSVQVVATSRRGHAPSVVPWDIAAESPPSRLKGPWDVIVNTAADTRWTQTPEQARTANVATVEALSAITDRHTHMIHISTAYAIGLRGNGHSTSLDDYRNSYEWSKAQAERVASQRFTRLSIVRPPLIIGRRSDGRAARFAGMYTVLRAMTASMVPAIVAAGQARFDVIPVDDLVRLIAHLAQSGPAPGIVTLAGGAAAPAVDAAIDLIAKELNDWRTQRQLPLLERPPVISPESWERFFLPFVREHLSPRQQRVLELLQNFQPYLKISEPLRPTHTVAKVEPAIQVAVRYWADLNSRQASLAPRPWKIAA